jgi:TIR domain
MPSMVLISHSSKDRATADTICAHLESAGIKCWIAPRDIEPGAT